MLRKHLHWLPTERTSLQAAQCPIFLYELPTGVFYGFPAIDGRGVKLGEHSGGEPIADPASATRLPDPADNQRVAGFASQQLGLTGPSEHDTCLYTMSPDGHFIVDRISDSPAVAVAAGFSGHGFKFAPVIGQALADLIRKKETDLPVDFLSMKRFDS